MMSRPLQSLFRVGFLISLATLPSAGALADENAPVTPSASTLPLDELRTFADVFGRIKDDYVEEAPDQSLIENAIRGMLGGLDPHSAYLNAEEYRDLQVGTSGEFGGLGIEIGLDDGLVKVIAPIDDTPAQRAGIQSGDFIVRIDDKAVKGLSLNEAVKLMRGEPGTQIRLTLMRGDNQPPFELTLERAVIQVQSVKSRTLEPGFGYIRLANFQAPTTDDMLKAIEALKTANGGTLRGLVLDLRNNPGGVLNGAVGVSDAFLTDGLIVYTQGRSAESRIEFKAEPEDVVAGAPIIVLVNSGSASASEIVAGALQDHKRALVMGTQTFGKGSVQTIMPLSATTGLKLTTARYYTPSGRSIQAQGITPDIRLEHGEFKPRTQQDLGTVKEADLARHLEQTTSTEMPATDNAKALEKTANKLLIAEDFQLSEALTVLKGLTILNRASKP